LNHICFRIAYKERINHFLEKNILHLILDLISSNPREENKKTQKKHQYVQSISDFIDLIKPNQKLLSNSSKKYAASQVSSQETPIY